MNTAAAENALLTLAAIRAIALREPNSPLRTYVVSITDDLDLPARNARNN